MKIWKWFWKARSHKKMMKFWIFFFILGGFEPPQNPPKMKIFFQIFIIYFGLLAFKNHFHIRFSISGSVFRCGEARSSIGRLVTGAMVGRRCQILNSAYCWWYSPNFQIGTSKLFCVKGKRRNQHQGIPGGIPWAYFATFNFDCLRCQSLSKQAFQRKMRRKQYFHCILKKLAL